MQIRPFQPKADLETVLAFLAQVEAETGVPPLGESKFVDLTGPGEGAGLIGGGSELSVYAHTLHHPASRLTEMELAARLGTTDEEIASMVETVAARVDQRLLWWTFGETRAAEFAAGRLSLYRQLHKLVGPLPLSEERPQSEELRVVPFRSGVDDHDWLVVNNAAFLGHPENGQWSNEDLDQRLGLDWYEAEGFRLAWVGDRLAGFCWTKRHDAETGEIYVIAVHPDFQGKGLGRLIVVEALWYLADAGCTTALLYVDTINQSALRLYQSLGFARERVDRCFAVPKDWPQDPQ